MEQKPQQTPEFRQFTEDELDLAKKSSNLDKATAPLSELAYLARQDVTSDYFLMRFGFVLGHFQEMIGAPGKQHAFWKPLEKILQGTDPTAFARLVDHYAQSFGIRPGQYQNNNHHSEPIDPKETEELKERLTNTEFHGQFTHCLDQMARFAKEQATAAPERRRIVLAQLGLNAGRAYYLSTGSEGLWWNPYHAAAQGRWDSAQALPNHLREIFGIKQN